MMWPVSVRRNPICFSGGRRSFLRRITSPSSPQSQTIVILKRSTPAFAFALAFAFAFAFAFYAAIQFASEAEGEVSFAV
jgi:hypothetical protein